MTSYIVEVCVDCMESLQSALGAGASRIELCSALSEGGLTPSMAFIREAVRIAPKGAIYVMIRPRMGDFLYNSAEQRLMLEEIALLKGTGIGGIVLGALQENGALDLNFIKQAQALLDEGVDITFHRAFDVCRDRSEALEQLVILGVKRILTSGGAVSAKAGITELSKLQQQAKGRITLIVAGGVSPDNIQELRDKTQAVEFHLSAKVIQHSPMQYRNPAVYMGRSEVDEYSRYVACAKTIQELIQRLNEHYTSTILSSNQYNN